MTRYGMSLHLLIEALGWTLVHFIWQGIAIAFLLWVFLKVISESAAQLRYGLSCLTLGIMLCAPVLTFHNVYQPISTKVIEDNAPASVVHVSPSIGNPGGKAPLSLLPISPGRGRMAQLLTTMHSSMNLTVLLPYLVGMWLFGVALLSVRVTVGIFGIRYLRTTHVERAPVDLQIRLAQIAKRLGIKQQIRFYVSSLVHVPMAFGWLRPTILVPFSIISGLTTQQLETILIHELAHIRRRDYLINIMQCLVETLLFYHPCVWWVSQQIRITREHCCDDMVLTFNGGQVLTYAKALTQLETLKQRHPQLMLTAKGGSLMQRIERMTHQTKVSSRHTVFSWITGLFVLTLVASAYVGSLAYGTLHVSNLPVNNPVVVLDPGYVDPFSNYISRDDFLRNNVYNLQVTQKVMELLQAQGITVIITSDPGELMFHAESPDLAGYGARISNEADLFLSIRVGRAFSSHWSGISTFYWSELVPNHSESPSGVFANLLRTQLQQITSARDRGISRTRFGVLHNLQLPAAIVNIGLVTNQEEARRLATDEYQSMIAEKLASGIMAFLDRQ